MKKYQYKLEGLDCANCANKIQEELSKNKKLKNVMVNFAKLQLTYETEDVSKEEVEKVVKRQKQEQKQKMRKVKEPKKKIIQRF